MPHAYSNDLRRKLLEAHDRGEGSLKILAARFSVSEDFAYKISAARRRTGSMDRQPQRRPVSQVDTGQITVLLNGQPDMTLPELQQAMIASRGQRISVPHLCRLVKKLAFRRKRSRSTPPSGIRKRTGRSGRSS